MNTLERCGVWIGLMAVGGHMCGANVAVAAAHAVVAMAFGTIGELLLRVMV